MTRLISAGLIIVFAICAFFVTCAKERRVPFTPAQIDSLKNRNQLLEGQRGILLAQVAERTIERDSFRRERDSLKKVSDSATDQIHRDRAKLPAAEAVPDSMLRTLYAAGLQQLDRAVIELGRKNLIIYQDSLDRIRSDSIEADLRALLDLVAEQYKDEQLVSAHWYNEYEKEINKRRCGKKCGIVIGVVATIGGAIAIRKVQQVLEPPR